jgi:AcrR family transcriptional regulator
MASTVSERHSDGKVEILSAAARAFAEHGYHGMSMRDLAKATGRAPATLYNYFDSKEELLFTLQRDSFDALIAGAEHALAGVVDPGARLDAFVTSHVRYFAANPDVMRVLVHEAAALPPPHRGDIRARKQRYFDIGHSIVRDLVNGESLSSIEVERRTYSLFGMLNWMWGWYEADRHGTPETVAESIVRMARGGLLAPV